MIRPALNAQERDRIINEINNGDDKNSLIIYLNDCLCYNIQRINTLEREVSTLKTVVGIGAVAMLVGILLSVIIITR